MAISAEISVVLESRAFNYLLFQSVFGGEPTKELIETVCNEATLQSLELFALNNDSPYSCALEAALLALDALPACSENPIATLRSVYTKLFLGPTELKAPPWESVYVSKKRQLFEESTLKVRNFYRSWGFLPVEYPRVADDHIALECAFMARLGEQAKNACGCGDATGVTALRASSQFLEEHLLVWLPDYVSDLRETKAPFYPIMAQLAFEFMKVDRLILDELIGEL